MPCFAFHFDSVKNQIGHTRRLDHGRSLQICHFDTRSSHMILVDASFALTLDRSFTADGSGHCSPKPVNRTSEFGTWCISCGVEAHGYFGGRVLNENGMSE